MLPTVYIETTIIGHLTTRLPKDQRVVAQMLATRAWWNDSRHNFQLFTSEAVIVELAQGDPQAAAERLELAAPIPLIPVQPASAPLTSLLLSRHALPAKARIDAAHVAIAATNGMQYLLTWNCRHLANATLRSKIADTCREMGFEPPIICTPEELNEVPYDE